LGAFQQGIDSQRPENYPKNLTDRHASEPYPFWYLSVPGEKAQLIDASMIPLEILPVPSPLFPRFFASSAHNLHASVSWSLGRWSRGTGD